MKLRQGVADALVGEGADVVFALIGDGNEDFIADLGERRGVPIVAGRHEQGVVGMADGYARFSGRPGVATVTSGPGLTNTATSLVAAARRRAPVLVVAGDVGLGDVHNPQIRPAGVRRVDDRTRCQGGIRARLDRRPGRSVP